MDRLRSQDFYTSGIVDGPTREWWSDGTPKAEGRYRRGRPVGDFRKWHENGRLAMVKHFDEGGFGDLIKIEEWDEDGNVVPRR
jgi:antitoxin component YwqK of YwqJK toxin-antitoxin module